MPEIIREAGIAREIIEQMRRVAAPGQDRLDASTLRRLKVLTQALIAVKADAIARATGGCSSPSTTL
jgi:hypothetical protein